MASREKSTKSRLVGLRWGHHAGHYTLALMDRNAENGNFRKLKDNLADDDPARHDEMLDEFRTLILGR